MAVYTKVGDAEAAELLLAYDLGALETLTGIEEGVENTNYQLRTSRGRYILTLYEKRVKAEDLPFFLGLMEHLGKKGIPCPAPVYAKDGRVLRDLAGRKAVITSFLEGEVVRETTPEHCAEVGRALAALHAAGKGFTLHRANALSLRGWEKLLRDCYAGADDVKVGLNKILGDEFHYLRTHWPRNLPNGIIHADLFHDNVHFMGTKLTGLFDFYFACEDFLAYDLATCLNAWCFEPGKWLELDKTRALLRGYEEKRPLSKAEKAALPVFARGAALRFLLTRLYDWLNQIPGAQVRARDPLEFLARLQFQQTVSDVKFYGIDP